MNMTHQVRPKKGETVSGDGVWVKQQGALLFVAVMDGVGHGKLAAEAVERAKKSLESASWNAVGDVMEECHIALKGTVGVCIALLCLNEDSGEASYASVGNIELYCPTNSTIRPCPSPGIVGGRMRKVLTQHFTLEQDDILLLCTDGIQRDFSFVDVSCMSLDDIVDLALSRYGKEHDDATCLAVSM
jgi:serine/threonine protein phosphatase PrpC